MNQTERIGSSRDRERRTLQSWVNALRVASPGIVTAVDLDAQTVSVKLCLQGKITDESGEPQFVELPLLTDVPIVWPRAGGFALTLPVKAGDECLVVFGDQCIDAWWQSGGVQKPMDERRHDLSDGFAIFGITSQPRKLPSVQSDAIELRTETRSGWISLKQGALDIHIEGATTIYTKTQAQVNCESAEVNASASAKIDSPQVTITGDTKIEKTLMVVGQITGTGGLAVSGGSGATVDGSMKTTGDVQAGGISLQGHVHGGVQGGSGTTGTPR